MAQKPETLFKQKVQKDIKAIQSQGGRIWAFKTQMVALLGIPDIILCVNGEFWAMELKKDLKSKPTTLQRHVLQLIQDAGGRTSVESPETWHSTLVHLAHAAFGEDEPGGKAKKAGAIS